MKVSKEMDEELGKKMREVARLFLGVALGNEGTDRKWMPMLLTVSDGTPRMALVLGPENDAERMECLAFALASEVDHENPRPFERMIAAARYLLQTAFEDPSADFLVVPVSTGPAGRFMSVGLVGPGQTDPVVNLENLIKVLRVATGKLEQAKAEAVKGPILC